MLLLNPFDDNRSKMELTIFCLALGASVLASVSSANQSEDDHQENPWQVIEDYANKHKDSKLDGKILVDWYQNEFKNLVKDSKLRMRVKINLEKFILFLELNKPDDCTAERVTSLVPEISATVRITDHQGDIRYQNLMMIYLKQKRSYLKICQLKLAREYEDLIESFDPATQKQMEMIDTYAKRVNSLQPERFELSINLLSEELMKRFSIEYKDRTFENLNELQLRSACRSHLEIVGQNFFSIYSDLIMWFAGPLGIGGGYSHAIGGFTDEVSEEARNGWFRWALCRVKYDS